MLSQWYVISQTSLIVTIAVCSATLWTVCAGSRPRTLLAVIFSVLFCGMATLSVFDFSHPDFRPEKLNFVYNLACIAAVGLIYLYFRLLMEPWRSWHRFAVRLGGGLGCAAVIYAASAVLCSDAPALYSVDDILAGAAHPVVILRMAAFASFIAALILGGVSAWKRWQRHKKAIADQFSFREGISLSWIPSMIILYALLGAWTIYDLLISGDVGWELIVSNFFYTVFYLVVSLMGLHQRDVYTEAEVATERAVPEMSAPSNGNGMSAAVRDKLKNDLVRLMETERVYRDPNLRLNDVVRALNTNRTYLTAVIRENFENNFIGFVNGYRIREAQELLCVRGGGEGIGAAPLMMKELADRVGFKSISSFYTFFKRETGSSPTEFREKAESVLSR